MVTSAKAMILGLVTALAGLVASTLPPMVNLETDLGLEWLFTLRGSRPAPPEVIVVTIDHESSHQLGLRNDPQAWPRSHHARLVRNLVAKGARVIVFDIFFEKTRSNAQNRLFARAIHDAGNVVLFEYLKKERLMGPDDTPVSIVRRVLPTPVLAEAGAALAPFPLPKVPVKVSQCWLFKSQAGDAPTLPVVAFQVYARPYYQDFRRLLHSELGPKEAEWLPNKANIRNEAELARRLRQLFQAHPELARRLIARLQEDAATLADPQGRLVLASLITMYSGRDYRYLDFYGPPRSITTIPYYQILNEPDLEPAIELHGKAVFIGFSEQFQPEQRDGFYTVFSQPDGLDMSGVEIAATSFANLLEHRSVEPLEPPASILLIVFWGMTLGALFLLLPPATMIPAAGVFAAAYTGVAYHVFALEALWVPLVVPLLLQIPHALLGALLWRYLDTRKERQKIRKAFGYYLPGRVVDELTNGTDDIPAKGQLVYGICLATDAEQYTSFSETLEPDRLRSLMNRYYETLFEPVRRRGGFISDVVGDAMLALWATPTPDRLVMEQACYAALDIITAVDQANRLEPGTCLPTRIGLHCGEVLLGNVGAGDHYEYRAVGDIVNTATRIQSLNKQLGTRVLTSCELIEDLDGIATREIGSFLLRGKSRPLVIHELVGRTGEIDVAQRNLHAYFAAGLQAFQRQCWAEARAAFTELLARYGNDGPARYYLHLCEWYTQEPPLPPWDGVISLGAMEAINNNDLGTATSAPVEQCRPGGSEKSPRVGYTVRG